jgi:hypothetical protein
MPPNFNEADGIYKKSDAGLHQDSTYQKQNINNQFVNETDVD